MLSCGLVFVLCRKGRMILINLILSGTYCVVMSFVCEGFVIRVILWLKIEFIWNMSDFSCHSCLFLVQFQKDFWACLSKSPSKAQIWCQTSPMIKWLADSHYTIQAHEASKTLNSTRVRVWFESYMTSQSGKWL